MLFFVMILAQQQQISNNNKMNQQTRQFARSSQQTVLNRKYQITKTVTNSQQDISNLNSNSTSNLNFLSNHSNKDNKKLPLTLPVNINMHTSIINNFVIIIKQIQKKFIKEGFLKLISLRSEKRMKMNVANHLASIIKSKIILQKTIAFGKFKIAIFQKNNLKNFLNLMAIIYKRKYKQNLSYTMKKLKQHIAAVKIQDLNQMKNKIKMSLSKNNQSKKSIQSIVQIVFPHSPKNGNLSPRQIQKQMEFNKFVQGLEQNRVDKNYTQLRINIGNLARRFGKEEKYTQKVNDYNNLNQLIVQVEKYQLIIKQSTHFIERLAAIDPEDVKNSIIAVKGIKKQISMAKSRLQKKQEQNQETLKVLSSIQKIQQNLNSLLQAKIAKNSQKNKTQTQLQHKITSMMKTQTDMKKIISNYEQNQRHLKSLLQKSSSFQDFLKQLDQSRKHKKRAQLPHTLLIKFSDYFASHKKNLNELNMIFKTQASLFQRKNLSEESFNTQLQKLSEKYQQNQLFSSIQQNLNFLVFNVQEKQKFVVQNQMKKIKFQNQKLTKYVEGQKLKINILTQELNKQKNNIKLYQTPQKVSPQHMNLQFEELSSNLKVTKQKVSALQSEIKQWQKTVLNHQVADEILLKVIQKIQRNEQTWMKDVQSLKKGKNDKYQTVIKAIQNIQKLKQQNQRIKAHNVSQMDSNLLDQSFLVIKDLQQMNSIIRKVLSNSQRQRQSLDFVSNIKNPNLANLVILLEAYRFNLQLVRNFAKQRQSLQTQIFQKDQNNQNQQHILRFIKKCEEELPRKQYLSNDEGWNERLTSYQHPNSVLPQITKLLKKLSKQFRSALAEQRQSQIKHHQHYKLQINNLSDSLRSLEIDMKQKQLKYKQELNHYQRNQQISARKSLQSVGSKKSLKSAKSAKSITSQSRRSLNQQNQKYKQMLEQYAKDQKIMLQRINTLTQEIQKLKFQLRNSQNSLRKVRLALNQEQIKLTQKTRQLAVRENNDLLERQQLNDKIRKLENVIASSPSSDDKQELIYFKQAYSILLQKYQQKAGPTTKISQYQSQIKLIHSQIQQRIKRQYQQKYQYLKQQNTQLQSQKQYMLTKYHEDVVLIQKQLSQETQKLKLQLQQYRAQTVQRSEYQHVIAEIQRRQYIIQELNKQVLFLNKKISINQKYNPSIDFSQDTHTNMNQSVENSQNQSQNIRQVTQNAYVVTHSSSSSNLNSNIREISQVEQLRLRLRQFEQQKVNQIEHEVIMALKYQQSQFNEFLAKNNNQREVFYENVVIPERIKLWEHQYRQANPNVVQHITNTTTLQSNQIQLIVNEKYQEWKHTYLVAYLEQAKKRWLQQFTHNQLQLIINQKMSEWQTVRLFAILKQKRNTWIVQKLVEQRQAQWRRIKDLEMVFKIKQLQKHWQTIVLPERIKQWQVTHSSTITHIAQNTFTQIELQRIISQEHLKWQHIFEQDLQNKIIEVQKYWEFHILPERKKQWEITVSQTHSTASQLSVNVEQIINAKYEEWKHTYLVQYLKLAKLKWLEQFKSTELQLIIQQKYTQWQGVRLLSIVKDPKNSWILQSIVKEKHFLWQKQKQQEWTIKLRDMEVYYQKTVLSEKQKQWKLHSQQQLKLMLQKQSILHVNIEEQIKKRQAQWQLIKEREINTKIIEVEQYWQNVILPDSRKQWEQEFIVLYQKEHKPQNIDYEALINQKYEQWKHTYLVEYLKLQRLKWLEQFKSKQLDNIINAKFTEWESVRLWSIVTQSRNKWIIDKLLSEYRLEWERTKQHEWSLRVVQIEQFWQNQLAKNRRQWELTSGNKVSEVIHQQQRKIEIIVNQRIEQWRKTYLSTILNQKYQQWHSQFINIQLQKILNEKQNEWHSHFMNVELINILNSKQVEWTRSKDQQFNVRLSRAINQERLRIQNIQSQQLNTLSNEADKNQIIMLKKIIDSKSEEVRQFEKQFKSWEKFKLENVALKESIYRLENQNMKHLNQLKLKYQSTISEVTHEKSMLLMQIKELQLNLSKKSKDGQSPNLVSLQKQIITLEATCKSKDSEITFLKRSLDTASHQNQQLQSKINSMNSKIHTLDVHLEEAKNQAIKFQYELKYWKQKEVSMSKKIQTKESQLNQFKKRFQFEKSQLQKRIRELSTNSQTQSTLQIKISELQSQLSMKNNNIKSLQNELQRRKRDIQQQKLKHQNLNKQIEIYKNSLRQHESIIQQHKLQNRKYYQQIQRLKSYVQAFESKQKNYHQQIRRLQSRPVQNGQLQDLVRENQRLRVQLFRLKQKILYMENQESREIANLKETISIFEQRTKYESTYQKEDHTEIQILKRINNEISELVSANKQLQLRIIVLQNQKHLTSFGLNISRFFQSFQEQLDNFINYLVSNQIFKPDANTVYSKFTLKSREALAHGYIEDYFRQWQSFMRNLLEDNLSYLSKQAKQQREQISELKRTTTNIKISDGSLAEQSQEIIQKYDMILNDAKFLLKQYLDSNDRQYVKLMATSLGLDQQIEA